MMVNSHFDYKLSDRYELTEPIGQGAMGRVYLASDLLLGGVPVAVKFLSQTLLDEKMRDRFLREAMTCAQLGQKSIHVVRVTDYGVSSDEVPFYVMEYLKGQSLSQLVQQPLTVPRFLGLTRQILLGLQTAHAGIAVNKQMVPIIHRDIKPSNILVIQDPTVGELVKILDFGIAKLLQTEGDHTGGFMGTLAYSSPEQMEGQELDPRSDIYSLGVMMYQMLEGNLPLRPSTNTFGGWYKAHHREFPRPLIEQVPQVPRPLSDLVMGCLEKRAADRPQSVLQILQQCQALEEQFGIGTAGQLSVPSSPLVRKLNVPATESGSITNQFCRQQHWPADKPIAQIVFPQILQPPEQRLPSLWVMLPPAEIEQRVLSTRYNNFMCTQSPHPMVLWLTALYSSASGPRWLPCYLDLKLEFSQRLLWLLGDVGYYQLLFFSSEAPHHCEFVKRLNVAASQRNLLKSWVTTARTQTSVGCPNSSKELLRRELNQSLKPKLMLNFESMHSDSKPGIDAMLGL